MGKVQQDRSGISRKEALVMRPHCKEGRQPSAWAQSNVATLGWGDRARLSEHIEAPRL
jgi:hypothetical protein